MTKHALLRLEHCVNEAYGQFAHVRISGSISEVTPAYARVVGLSRFLKLGECVTFTAGEHRQLAEVVQIDEHGATVKTFDTSVLACLGERVIAPMLCASFPIKAGRVALSTLLDCPSTRRVR